MSHSLEHLAHGLFMFGFDGLTPTDAALRFVDQGLFGAILFRRNVDTPAQVAALVRALKVRAARPLCLAVDQEGGRVARLRGAPFVAVPPMRTLGAGGDERLVERAGALLGFELRALGFDWDFAPVVDVDTNPKNPVIGDRAFSNDPRAVARLGVALARGLEREGVASCAKHFPGHGDTAQDSHLALPRLPHALDRLEAVELVPFAAYAQAKLAAVMTAHIVFDAVDPTVPATMSRAVLTGLLREKLGFEGVIVSDDLEMKAIASHYGIADAVLRGLEAGVDLFLVCHSPDVQRAAVAAVVEAVERGRVSKERLLASQARLAHLARRFVKGPEDLLARLGGPDHQALAAGLTGPVAAAADPTEAWRRA